MSKTIPLTNGLFAIVDDEDYEMVSGMKWHAAEGYAVTTIKLSSGFKYHFRMHRYLMGLERGDKRQVDHINGVKTDNQRSNLRFCSHAENMRNRNAFKRNKGALKGVSWHKRDRAWEARIAKDGKRIHLGYFDSAEAAHEAYCAAANKLHGEFANHG